jgi:hypothetical protein
MPAAASNSSPPRRRLRAALLFLGALLFLFEEALWVGFMRLFAWLGRFGLLRWLDARLARLGPVVALVCLCVPIALLFPVKIMGLWMIAGGRLLAGCCVMLLAKIASTAIVARIFFACRPQLLRMPWFARLYNVACALRDRVHDWLSRQPAWRQARRFVARLRALARLFGRGFGRGPGGATAREGVLRRWRRGRRRTAMAAASAARSSARR